MTIMVSSSNMRAVVVHRPSSAAELRVEDLDRPAVAADGLLVRVRASSANPVDLLQLSLAGYLLRGLKPTVVGSDFAGVVEAAGSRVTHFRIGDEVFGAAHGAFADYVSVAEGGAVVPKPVGVSFEDAGTLAVAASTALQAIRDQGHLEPGQRVLINGASGGVGTFAVQIAKALEGDVTAVCSSRNVDMVRSIGADAVVDYTQQDFARRGEQYDLIVDIAGSHPLSACMQLLGPGGVFVGVGAAALQHRKAGALRALAHLARIWLASARKGDRAVRIFVAKLRKEDLSLLGELVATGKVRPVIERTFDLDHAGEALARMDEGHLQGKLGIAVSV
jgi:NADPH:quinone reductase-like Zn-dependent oxidoreductase